MTQEQAYEMLNITRGGAPTLAAVMNFGAYPQGFFPQFGIIATVVPGTQIGVLDDRSARFLDNKRIEGTIAAMAEEAMAFCRRNMKINTIIDPETGLRTDRAEYPIEAIREAILNVLIHRDYSAHTEGTPIQINFFTDRIEIHSPGNLYGRMSIEQLGIARPDLRNPALAVMTENLIGSENRYSGIPTMRRAMKEYGLPEPKFENRRQEFVVTLYNGSRGADVEHNSEPNLLMFCRTPRTRKEIADHLGLTTISHVQKSYIDPMIDSGQIAMTIPDKPRSRYQKFYTVRE